MSRPLSSESVYRAIADPTRRRMLDFLRAGDRPVADLIAPFRLKNPVASYHLRVLRVAGLVRQRRQGVQRVYGLQRKVLQEASTWLRRFDGP
jgi:DNA-binding transcriptional ArsR family regulator